MNSFNRDIVHKVRLLLKLRKKNLINNNFINAVKTDILIHSLIQMYSLQ